MSDSLTHEMIAKELLRRLGAAHDMSPLVLAECACAHATLALADVIRDGIPPVPDPPQAPPAADWLHMEGG